MGGIFINYRGADTDTAAALIDRELASRFGSDRVFLDCRSIPVGADFVEELLGRLRACGVLLVVIGPRWLTLTDAAGRRRIDDPRDWIRREIVEAFAGGLRVIPVLTGNVALPAEADLPQDMAGLSRRQYVPLRRRYTSVDLAFLVERIMEADPELAEVAARRQSSTGRVPRQMPAAVADSAGMAPKHARHGRGATRSRRLILVLLPIAAALLVTLAIVFTAYRFDQTPHALAPAPEPTPTTTTTTTTTTTPMDQQTGSAQPTVTTPRPTRATKEVHLAVDYGIDLDSKAPNWSYAKKSQSPFFLDAGQFGAAYGTEVTKIDDNATIGECRNATGFGPSAELKLGANAFPQDGDTFTVCAHTGSGHYAVVSAILHGGAQNFTAADLSITIESE